MKFIITAITLIFSVVSFAQKEAITTQSISQQVSKTIHFDKKITSSEVAKTELIRVLHLSNHENLTLLHTIPSQYGIHYTFIETFMGHEVYNAHIKVSTDKEGNLIKCFSNYAPISAFKEFKSNAYGIQQLKQSIAGNVQTSKLVWLKVADEYELHYQFNITDEQHQYYQAFYDINKSKVQQVDLLNHYTEVDTTALGLVFSPNPVTSAHTNYGGNYVDNDDNTNAQLDAERDTVSLRVDYTNGTYFLENEYVKIVEISLPTVPPVQRTDSTFFYDRSQSGFEDVNVLYHMTQQQDYIQQLGFTNIVNYQLEADCHGFGGADNSAFDSGTNPPSIIFGEGGVDDAEDTDVIIHEYTHAIMHSASPGTNFGTERNAMDEAFGDYMAVSYSNQYTNFHSDYAFKWDGHNEYWDGRLTISDKMYPDDLVFNLYGDAPIWSSALTRIERNLGRDVSVTLALESAYGFISSMTMAQAAELFIATDNTINQGDHYATLCYIFKDKGMISSCAVPRPGGLLSTPYMVAQSSINLIDSENSSLRNAPIQISSNSNFKVHLFDLAGKLVCQKEYLKGMGQVSTEQLEKGTYVLEVTNETERKSFKIQLLR